jgi:hypothetical protein
MTLRAIYLDKNIVALKVRSMPAVDECCCGSVIEDVYERAIACDIMQSTEQVCTNVVILKGVEGMRSFCDLWLHFSTLNGTKLARNVPYASLCRLPPSLLPAHPVSSRMELR